MTKVYVGDIGTELLLDVGQSLAAATAVSIEARKPNGGTVSWVGAVSASTKVRFVSLADTFDEAGDWALQAKVVMPAGTWLGETAMLKVYKPFG